MLRSLAFLCVSTLLLVPAPALAGVIWYYGGDASSDFTADHVSPITEFPIPYSIVVDEPTGAVVTLWGFQRSIRRVGPAASVSIELDGTGFDTCCSLRVFSSGTYTFSDFVRTFPPGDAVPLGLYSPGAVLPTLFWSYGSEWPEEGPMNAVSENGFLVRVLEDEAPSIAEPATGALLLSGLVAMLRRKRP